MNVLEEPEATYDWMGYRSAWADYARKTLKIDPGAFLGGCDTGKMPVAHQVRLQRIAEIKGQAGGEVHEVDWKYTKGQAPPRPLLQMSQLPPPQRRPAAARPPTTQPAVPPCSGGCTAQAATVYYCQWIRQPANGQGGMTFYLTDAFSSTTPAGHHHSEVAATRHRHLPPGRLGPRLGALQPCLAGSGVTEGGDRCHRQRAKASKAQVVNDKWSD
jgi:hypothetical protein